jgi:hypothetical protein
MGNIQCLCDMWQTKICFSKKLLFSHEPVMVLQQWSAVSKGKQASLIEIYILPHYSTSAN